MRVILKSVLQLVKEWKKNYRVVAAFLLGISMCLFHMFRYLKFAKALGSSVQMLEGYIICGNIVVNYIGILLGILLLLSDAPFATAMSPYEMLRFGRIKWILARMIYIIVSCLIYSVAMLVVTGVFSLIWADGFLSDQWSEAMVVLAERQPDFAISKFRLSFPYSNFIQTVTPYKAAGLTVLLGSLYTIFVSMCILSVNLLSSKNIGWIVGGGIHVIGYIIYSNHSIAALPVEISLLRRAIPVFHYLGAADMTIFITVFVFIVLILAVSGLCIKWSGRIELFCGGEV